MKLKHSKYKNTGLIFDILSRKMVSEVLSGEGNVSANIVKKHFNAKSELRKELKLYHTLINETARTPQFADRLIEIVLDIRKKLNGKKLNEEKYKLISEIKKYYNFEDFFASRATKYKESASVYKLFESTPSQAPSDYLQCRETLIESITKTDIETPVDLWAGEDSITKKLAFKLIVEKFNERYKGLNTKQKELLSKYINTDIESDDFKTYVITEVLDVTKKLQRKNIQDPTLKIKINEICNLSEKMIASKFVKEEHLSSLLKFYQLQDVLK
jgi:hypothetical protein